MRHPRRLTPVPVIAFVLAVLAAASTFAASPAFPWAALARLQAASGGWLQATLVAGGAVAVLALSLLLGPGRQRPGGLGWRWRALAPAAGAGLLLWAAMQASTVIASAAGGQPLDWHPAWARGLGAALGPLVAQLLATALMEETVFRAWLWPQLAARMPGLRPPWLGPLLALVAAQLLFALFHLPAALQSGAGPAALAGWLAMLFVVGMVYGLVYWATGNLFLVVAAHALGNAPTLLFAPQGPAPGLVLLVALLAVAAWWRGRRRAAGGRGPLPALG